MPRIFTADAISALRTLVREEVVTAAWNNDLVSQKEQKLLDPFEQAAVTSLRAERFRSRPTVDQVTERTVARAVAVWDRFSGETAQDKAQLSQSERAQIAAADPALGKLTQRALALLSHAPRDNEATVKAFFRNMTFPNRELHDGLPQGERVDARPGRAERASVPDQVLASFDWWYRAEDADWATASLHKAKINGVDVWATYLTTDGDDAYLELMDAQGAPLASARVDWKFLRWDEFFGRGRLSDGLSTLSDPVQVDGQSEPAERASAGQVPVDFVGELRLSSGTLRATNGFFDSIEGSALTTSTPAHLRDAATFALDLMWSRSLGHRVADGAPALELGATKAGELVVGEWTNPIDSKSYIVANWRDIDDDSFVFYFERQPTGLRLAIEQYDN